MTGIAAGFGAVFGTPVAGAVFALEVLSVGRVEYDALVPCVLAAIVGDWTCHQWGVHHVGYHIAFAGYAVDGPVPFHIDALLLAKVLVAGVVFGPGRAAVCRGDAWRRGRAEADLPGGMAAPGHRRHAGHCPGACAGDQRLSRPRRGVARSLGPLHPRLLRATALRLGLGVEAGLHRD